MMEDGTVDMYDTSFICLRLYEDLGTHTHTIDFFALNPNDGTIYIMNFSGGYDLWNENYEPQINIE